MDSKISNIEKVTRDLMIGHAYVLINQKSKNFAKELSANYLLNLFINAKQNNLFIGQAMQEIEILDKKSGGKISQELYNQFRPYRFN